LLKVLDLFRDIFLVLIILISFLIVIKNSIERKKFNKFVFFELCFVIILTFFITGLLKSYYKEVRPISYFYPGEQFLDSFPSRHTALAVAISNIVLNNYLEWGIFLYLISFLVGLFSWFSLQHWPLDIIIGAFLGFIISVIVLEISKFFLRIYVKDRKEKFKKINNTNDKN